MLMFLNVVDDVDVVDVDGVKCCCWCWNVVVKCCVVLLNVDDVDVVKCLLC